METFPVYLPLLPVRSGALLPVTSISLLSHPPSPSDQRLQPGLVVALLPQRQSSLLASLVCILCSVWKQEGISEPPPWPAPPEPWLTRGPQGCGTSIQAAL